MKQLFLKSNLLHIRTNEGELEVSNPEIIGDPETIKIIFNNGKPVGGMLIEVIWPGGVELIHQYKDRGQWHDATKKVQWRMYNNNHDIRDVARLLPKEKKENKICIASHGPASTQAESAYKEFEGKGKLIGHIIDDFKNGKEIFVPAVESSEPQEKLKKGDAGFKWFTCPTCDGRGSVPQDSAPSESQPDIFYGYLEEGVYGEFRHVPEPSPNKDKIGFIFGGKRYEFSRRPNYEFKQVSVNPSLTIYQKWIYRVNEGLSETKK